MNNLISRTRAAVWHPCTQMKHLEDAPPLAIARGESAWLIDEDGKRYLDAISSWWVNLFGHCNPRINAALIDQLGKIAHVMLAGATHRPVVELSERLGKLTGLGHAFYASDGASATEIALKMSFHYWRNLGQPQKTGYISLKNAYHGETVGALSVTDVPLFKDVYAGLLRRNRQVMSPDWRFAESGESALAYALRAADALEADLVAHADTTAALIVEPLVQAAAGMGMYHAAYLQRARELCDRYHVHLIADEIAVGFGRTGTMFGFEQASARPVTEAPTKPVKPDFVCLSKGLTGGYLPLSAVLTTDTIYAAFYHDDVAQGFLHSHSYTGNPLACRAALAVLDIFETDETLVTNQKQAALLTNHLQPVAAHSRVRNFRHIGMIWAFEVNPVSPDFAARFHQAARRLGVFIRPIGPTVYLMPPYVLTESDMRLLVHVLLQCLDKLAVE